MATLAFSGEATDDLQRLASKSIQTSFRLINRLHSWAQRTPPLPSGSIHLGLSMSSAYQQKCTVDDQEFIIVFIYPHGIRKRFMVIGVYFSGYDADAENHGYTEDESFEIDS